VSIAFGSVVIPIIGFAKYQSSDGSEKDIITAIVI
jgi:hypothetical protein